MITLNTNPGLLRTAVYERILSDLQQGAIAPGETISLNKLAETLNISKTPCWNFRRKASLPSIRSAGSW